MQIVAVRHLNAFLHLRQGEQSQEVRAGAVERRDAIRGVAIVILVQCCGDLPIAREAQQSRHGEQFEVLFIDLIGALGCDIHDAITQLYAVRAQLFHEGGGRGQVVDEGEQLWEERDGPPVARQHARLAYGTEQVCDPLHQEVQLLVAGDACEELPEHVATLAFPRSSCLKQIRWRLWGFLGAPSTQRRANHAGVVALVL
mmetsp:Transcript_87866/g.246747  ORF Transcript_87866/g.246747 Transcript_87866/m.246747 type:complete len:200 (+) Transcript_87866:1137-1736(+)